MGVLIGLGLALLSSQRLVRKRAAEDGAARVPSEATPALALGRDGVRVSDAVRFSLLYILPPIWLASSLADWACHRDSRIEDTASVRESMIHLLLLGEMGLPVLATVFLEITSPIILMMIAAFLVHQVTVHYDLRVAVSKREVTPTEQMVHSFMEMMPLVGIWLVSLLREDELRALLGTSPRNPDFSVRLKQQPLPVGYRAGLITAIALLGGIPYIEELWRSARAAARRRTGSPIAPVG
jgi:hypothetical protein